MAKKPISYTGRDFESIKTDLENYAKRYYSSTFKDFNEASFGALMLDLVAYVGDQLSFYTDYQANESYMDTALEYANVIKLARQLGFRMPKAATSTGICSFYVSVPADAGTGGIDEDYLPILQRGAVLSSGVSVYTLNENIDFSISSNQVTVAQVDLTTGVPTHYAIKAFGEIVSGEVLVETAIVGNYQRFFKFKLDGKNISEILSIKDSQGNEYYEVDYLTQDIIYREVPNYASDRIAVPYIMKAYPAARRFTTETDVEGNVYVQFGYGSADNITTDVVADPADVVLNVTGRTYISSETFDPTSLINSDKFGVVPTDTVLTITYRANSNTQINASVGAVTQIVTSSLSFKEASVTLSATKVQAVIASQAAENEAPILGDTSVMTTQELKQRAYGTMAAQNRAVTREDYMTLCYAMPPKFGKVKRVNIIQDNDSLKRNLNLYVLSEDTAGNFTAPNETLKNNLKTWLNKKRMMNDTVDIFTGSIINYGIVFEVIPELGTNRYQLLQACVARLISEYSVKRNISEPIYISEIYQVLNDVPGVIDTTNVELVNKTGGSYSGISYDIDSNLSSDGRFLIIPQDSVAEILFPNEDISGVIK